mmetsp:Transcript_12842/g.29707  ORF Transcript_12842/g.29707 Transcript_12842/m.29707 type:complete len:449 (-) Transcript_12842:312-1658(-)
MDQAPPLAFGSRSVSDAAPSSSFDGMGMGPAHHGWTAEADGEDTWQARSLKRERTVGTSDGMPVAHDLASNHPLEDVHDTSPFPTLPYPTADTPMPFPRATPPHIPPPHPAADTSSYPTLPYPTEDTPMTFPHAPFPHAPPPHAAADTLSGDMDLERMIRRRRNPLQRAGSSEAQRESAPPPPTPSARPPPISPPQGPSRRKPAAESDPTLPQPTLPFPTLYPTAGRKRARASAVASAVVVAGHTTAGWQPSSRSKTRGKSRGAGSGHVAPVAPVVVDTSRGAHVRNRPEMQRQARDGQQHWAEMVKQKRDEWCAMPKNPHTEAFKAQVEICAQRNIKSQKECLIRFLHLSTATNVVKPQTPFKPLKDTDDDATSFLGWTGFTVTKGHGAAFRQGVEAMFQEESPKQNTVQNLFRRAGLVPEDWDKAWEGSMPFRFTSPAPTERKKAR